MSLVDPPETPHLVARSFRTVKLGSLDTWYSTENGNWIYAVVCDGNLTFAIWPPPTDSDVPGYVATALMLSNVAEKKFGLSTLK
jgi:hypothetical protein